MSIAGRILTPISACDDAVTVAAADSEVARLGTRLARAGDLVEAYPSGTHDRELAVEGEPTPAAVREFVSVVLDAHPFCRRVVLAVPEQDLDAIAWAEEAGFRYVVGVETRVAAYSLLVVEPEWVTAQPQDLDDIPIKE